MTLTAFSGKAVPGHRHAGRLLHRTAHDGSFVLVLDGPFDPAVEELLANGDVELATTPPDDNRVRIALLKHAYLARCLHEQAVPQHLDQVRTELLAARSASSRDEVPWSAIAAGLEILRIDPDRNIPPPDPVIHAVAHLDATERPGVLLGGTVFVTWDFQPSTQPPTTDRTSRFAATLTIGGKVPGTITGVTNGPGTA